jgi:hypothetical protein
MQEEINKKKIGKKISKKSEKDNVTEYKRKSENIKM